MIGAVWRLVLVLVWTAGCFFPPDPWPGDLQQGDVAGTVVGTLPGETQETTLGGARIRLKGSSLVVATRGNGRFQLRNLPSGSHALELDWTPPGESTPTLGAALTARVREQNAQRSSLDLGRVQLAAAGRIAGRVTGPPNLDVTTAVVVLAGTSVLVHPAPDGAFEIPGVGAGSWRVVAAVGALLSAPVDVVVRPAQVTRLDAPLVLATVAGNGTLQGELVAQPAPQQSTPPDVEAAFTLVALAAGPAPPAATVRGGFAQVAAVGLYVLELVAPDHVPLRIPNVLVWRDETTDLRTLLLMRFPAGTCVDLDEDGACALDLWDVTCSEVCRSVGPRGTCNAVSPPVDCDDDADGELDVEEIVGPAMPGPGQLPGPCRCGVTAGTQNGGACENDPTRADRDFDGACDIYDAFPLCALNVPDCTPPTMMDGGLPDASAGEDAGVDGGTMDGGSGVTSTVLDLSPLVGPFRSRLVAKAPSGNIVVATVHAPGDHLALPGANCGLPSSTLPGTSLVVLDPAGTCLQSWEFENGVLRGLDVDASDGIFVSMGKTDALVFRVGGDPMVFTLPATGHNLHIFRFTAAQPATYVHTSVVHGWDLSVTSPPRNLRTTPQGGVVVWDVATAGLAVDLGGVVFPPLANAAWMARLNATLDTVLEREFWAAQDTNPVPHAVQVQPDGAVVWAVRGGGNLDIYRTPAMPDVTVPLTVLGTMVRTWPVVGAPSQVLVPFLGPDPLDSGDALLAVGQTSNGVLLLGHQVHSPNRVLTSGVVYGSAGEALDLIGEESVMFTRYNGTTPSRPALLAVNPSQYAYNNLVRHGHVDAAGRSYVLGNVQVGVALLEPGQPRFALLQPGGNTLAAFVTRVDELGQASAVFALDASGVGTVYPDALHVDPQGGVTVVGIYSGDITFGAAPSCAGASPFAVLRSHPPGNGYQQFVWVIPPEAFTGCPAEPFTQAPDPNSGVPSAPGNIVLTSPLVVDLQPGDVDCFVYTPTVPGEVQVTLDDPGCANLNLTAYPPSSLVGFSPPRRPFLVPSACAPTVGFAQDNRPWAICLEGSLGAALPNVALAVRRGVPPANDDCAFSDVVDASTLTMAPFVTRSGRTVNATADPVLPGRCGLAGPVMDTFHTLTGVLDPVTVALRHPFDPFDPVPHVPALATLGPMCGMANPCNPSSLPLFLANQADGVVIAVHGAPLNPADQFAYELLVIPTAPVAEQNITPALQCSAIGSATLVDLNMSPSGPGRLSMAGALSVVDPFNLTHPTNFTPCTSFGFPSGSEVFFRIRVPDNVTLNLVAHADGAAQVALSLLDQCVDTGAACLAHENTQGRFDALSWNNNTGATADLVVLVDTSYGPPIAGDDVVVAWDSFP